MENSGCLFSEKRKGKLQKKGQMNSKYLMTDQIANFYFLLNTTDTWNNSFHILFLKLQKLCLFLAVSIAFAVHGYSKLSHSGDELNEYNFEHMILMQKCSKILLIGNVRNGIILGLPVM